MRSRDQLRNLIILVMQSGIIERKTLEQYLRQLRQYSRDYFNQRTDDGQFLDSMIGAINNQINRAWNEGMRANGLDPQTDKTDEMLARIAELVKNEEDHVTNLADLINQTRNTGDMTAVNARVDVWANRYTDVVNIAKVETGEDNQRYIWIYGDTEHCDTCADLNGKVLTAKEWRESGFHPQQPPNSALTCGGWRCKCRLEKTKKPRTGL